MEVENSIFFAAVEDILREGRMVTVVMRGTSMQPLLREPDKVTLAPKDGTEKVGDVVLFRYGKVHLLHRIKAIDGDDITMQGDNSYGCEHVRRGDIVARLVKVTRRSGKEIEVGSAEWQRLSRLSLQRKAARNTGIRWLGRRGRRQLRPWYFAAIIFLMWAPLNGVGIPLDNYILGLRADHLLHASVYIPMALFCIDLLQRKRWWLLWLAGCLFGLMTEYGQYLLPFRKFDINDMVANVIGVSLGWLAIIIYAKWKKNSTIANSKQLDNGKR